MALLGAVACVPSGSGDDGSVGPDAGLGEVEQLPPLREGVATLTGASVAGAADGRRGVARFNNPVNVLRTPTGDLLVADYDNGLIRHVTPNGEVSTLVAQENFGRPFGLVFVGETLYVQTDWNDQGGKTKTNGTIWRVDRNSGQATVVARDLGRPRGLAALPDGRIAMTDYVHHTVRILAPSSGNVTMLAGKEGKAGFEDGRGEGARFNEPYDAVVYDGALIIADKQNHALRRVTFDGDVTTFAGSANAGMNDGAVASATFHRPQGLAVTADGRLFVTDTDNFAVRMLQGGQVTTVAGEGVGGWVDDTDPMRARFMGIEGIDVGPTGDYLYMADGNRGADGPFHRVRRLSMP